MTSYALPKGHRPRPVRRVRDHGPLRLFFLWEISVVVAVALGVSLLVASIVTWAPAEVHGRSMEPTLHSGDRVVVRYEPARLDRGDVVVLAGVPGYGGPVTKRLVALPGDRVRLCGDHVLVNGVPEHAGHVLARDAGDQRAEFVVPAGSVFVLGDNRPVSLDSRMLGPLPLSSVKGVVDYVLGPGPAHPVTAR